MSENYIVINGKETELTEEQLKLLGIETRKNPFDRVSVNKMYYFIDAVDDIGSMPEFGDRSDRKSLECANYFNDEAFAKQVSLHQLLYRKLLKFAYDNGCEDTAKWDGETPHWSIERAMDTKDCVVCSHYNNKVQCCVYFSSDEAAKRAGREVVEPFMEEHPDFVW